MSKVEILCPDCGKLIVKVSPDSKATIYGFCRRCKAEKAITYPYTRAKEPITHQ
jgi:phage FluMu protein Com